MKPAYLLLLSAIFTPAAFAGPTIPDGKSVPMQTPPAKSGVEFSFKTQEDYDFSSDFKNNGAFGSQDAFHANVQLGVAVPISGPVYFTAVGFYDRFDFGTSLAPVPTTLHKVGADIGLEYRVNGKAAIALYASPGLYGSEINGDYFNVPVIGYASYQFGDNLIIVAGFRYNQWSDYTVLPLAGLIYDINDKIKINAILPDPAVEFTLNEDTMLRVGGEIVGGTYKTAKNEQNYPDQNLDYYDLRGGVGLSYKGLKPLVLGVSAGWSFKREFNYSDEDKTFKSEGAPYVSFTAKAVF